MDSGTDEELVQHIMATKVVTVGSDANVKQAASLMARRKCSRLFAVHGDSGLGIVTERELVGEVLAAGVDPSKAPISDIVSVSLAPVGPKASVVEAAEKMPECLIRRLGVVDEGIGALMGLLTANDVAKLLAKEKEYSDSTLNAMARMSKSGTGGLYE